MIRLRNMILFLALFAAGSVTASAFPMFLEAYKADKFTKPENKDVICSFCHMSPEGGDERNPFGQAFEKGGEVFTPMLRAQFPERFAYPAAKVSDDLTVHFSDPDNKIVIIETGGTRYAVDVTNMSVDGKAATIGGGGVASLTPARPAARPAAQNLTEPEARSEVPTDPYAREGAFFGQQVVDLPNGKPEKKGGVDFWIGHRFPEKTFQRHSPADLFGFDSVATVAFGVRAGLTDRLSVSASRMNYFRTIELAAAYQASRQSDRMPVTVQVRGSIEGRNNFVRYKNPWVGYGTSLQIVAVRTFADRVSVEAVPTFAFNTRNENSFFPQFESEHNNTIALGIGAGIRFLKTASIVGEYVPRLWGFQGERTDRPEISFGIQKATFRHAFSLVFSDMQPMTVSRYAQGTGGSVSAADTFGIGFNIYRKLH
jgi:Membrane bound beta barrel domain (DUF5777)